ncbi:MAG: ferritin family protein [Bacteroidetes bacterium]|nr:ferritin family protein [Bacteroidota bacterium]
MDSIKTLDILKMAILMEKRGYAFYTAVAEQSSDPDIGNIFRTMAAEETTHVKFLSEQFQNFGKKEAFSELNLPDLSADGIANMILSESVKKKIYAAGFEAAAISAAIDMEKKAIEVYSKQAETATDPNEIKLYKWLADWEKGHLKILNDLDNELKEKIWFDNQFWPF